MMNIGKYSPTVSSWYRDNPNWFHENCENENDIYDRDGYDSYGYNDEDIDRAGHDEHFYVNEWFSDHGYYDKDGEYQLFNEFDPAFGD